VEFEAVYLPAFDYAQQTHELAVGGEQAAFRTPTLTLKLHSTVPLNANG
jgi:hypothetical protein